MQTYKCTNTVDNVVQGHQTQELFRREQGRTLPILHPLDIPVRAVVLPVLDIALARRLTASVLHHLRPLMDPGDVWLQDPELLHSTLYHASTHFVRALYCSVVYC